MLYDGVELHYRRGDLGGEGNLLVTGDAYFLDHFGRVRYGG